MASHPLIIFGITGRMGQALIGALREGSPFHLQGAIASPASRRLNQDAALEGPPTGINITPELPGIMARGAVALDFSVGSAVAAHARSCAASGVPLLVGATGFDVGAKAELELAANTIPVLIAPNTSIAVAVLTRLAAEAAVTLGASYDVEISEAHHRHKRDAPSGTALSLGEAIAKSRAVSINDVAVFDRHGQDAPRGSGSIGFSVLRAGDIVGEHTVTFAGAGERLELIHRATDRVTFARGALRAAAWLIGRSPGLYGMKDVLFV